MFPTKSEVVKAYNKLKKVLWSDKKSDKALSWYFIGLTVAVVFSLLATFGHFFSQLVILYLYTSSVTNTVNKH